MNPLSHLVDKKYKKLDFNELMFVINCYADENKYPRPESEINISNYIGFAGRQASRYKAIQIFTDIYNSEYELKKYFKNWTK